MPAVYNKFNRGEVSKKALARDDVQKVNNSCELMENFIPERLGPMSFRGGTKRLGELPALSLEPFTVPFIASTTDTAILEFGRDVMRVWINDALLTRTATTDSTPDLPAAGPHVWTDASGVGSTAVIGVSEMQLTGSGSTSAKMYNTQTTADIGTERTLELEVELGPIYASIGTAGVDSSDIFKGFLGVGRHTLVFSPSSDVTFTFSNAEKYMVKLTSIGYASAGVEEFATPIGFPYVQTISYAQSADVVYLAWGNGRQYQVERRGEKSWSFVESRFDDGPFKTINTTAVGMAVGALSGDTTLTATEDYFSSDMVGALFQLGSAGQIVEQTVTAEDTGTDSIRVSGIKSDRSFLFSRDSLSGTGTRLTLQRSFDDASWVDIIDYGTDGTEENDDDLDNIIAYYRLWCKTGDYSSGSPVATITYKGGSIDGVARVTGYTSETVVAVQILKDFGSTDSTKDWYQGQWSDEDGYPSSVGLYEGRLWFAGRTGCWGSVSDAYTSFDRELEGDSRSIYKTIGYGPVDNVNWLAASSRLIMGIASEEVSVRSSSFGEVLTQDNVNLKAGSSQGSAPILPVNIDDKVYFVQRSKIKIMEAEYAIGSDTHKVIDLMTLHQDICSGGIVRIAVSRQPETRIFVVLESGEARIYLLDPAEEVKAWSRMASSSGSLTTNYLDVVVLPAEDEDEVYFVVERNGIKYLEKMTKFSEAKDYPVDSFLEEDSPAGTTMAGFTSFASEDIAVWADGVYQGTQVRDGDNITIPSGATKVVAGFPITAKYKSNKLGQYARYSVLGQRVRVVGLSLIADYLYTGVDGEDTSLKYGPDFSTLDNMPLIEDGTEISRDSFIEFYDEDSFEFNGDADTNSRVCLEATGPCSVMALVLEVEDDADQAPKRQGS